MSTTDRTVAADGILTVQQVAHLLETDRAWVYQHVVELGAFRIGHGVKAHLGFDRRHVEGIAQLLMDHGAALPPPSEWAIRVGRDS